MNSLPLPGPSLRADTVPPCSSTRLRTSVSPSPRPPCDAVERLPLLHEQVEDARQQLGRDADAGVAHAQHRPRRPLARARTAIAPPGGVYLAALVSRFATTCASRVGSPSTRRPRRGTSTVSVWVRCSSSGLAISIAFADHLGQLDDLGLQLDLAARDARDVEQVVDQPRRGG